MSPPLPAVAPAALRKHITRPGVRVAVLGVGGLGHLALQFARAMGADVTAIDANGAKEGEALALGAHRFLRYDPPAPQAPGGGGHWHSAFDLILNCASGALDSRSLLAMLRANATLVQVGIPGGGALITLPLQARCSCRCFCCLRREHRRRTPPTAASIRAPTSSLRLLSHFSAL